MSAVIGWWLRSGVIVVILEVLVSTFTKKVLPLWRAEVRKGRRIGGNRREPVVEDDMKLGRDGSSVEAEDEGDR